MRPLLASFITLNYLCEGHRSMELLLQCGFIHHGAKEYVRQTIEKLGGKNKKRSIAVESCFVKIIIWCPVHLWQNRYTHNDNRICCHSYQYHSRERSHRPFHKDDMHILRFFVSYSNQVHHIALYGFGLSYLIARICSWRIIFDGIAEEMLINPEFHPCSCRALSKFLKIF